MKKTEEQLIDVVEETELTPEMLRELSDNKGEDDEEVDNEQ